MSRELFWLTLTVALTGVLWVPYILDRIQTRGLMATLGNPQEKDPPQSAWAERLMRAHVNAVENLVVFAALVLTAEALNIHSGLTAAACATYFWARLAHAVVYTLGIPVARTLAFAVGWVAQVALVLAIFGAA
ncbi:MAG TPA: MAPEG family protein [Xanthobacteraceae bacterium]|nr:MAPEG family protein [Xanthobacteraceae bacterium]